MTPRLTRSVFIFAPLILASTLVSACAPGTNPFARNAAPADTSVATAKSVKLVDRDVEAPDVFAVSDAALWDGRPSLGGVWVASPDAVDPERVIMRNPANGKFVIGALFKRERDNPGPSLQISSDAAAALGLLAGAPAQISVTALRREEAPAAVDAAAPILDAAETVQTEVLADGAAPSLAAPPTLAPAALSTAALSPTPLASPAPVGAVIGTQAAIDISPIVSASPAAPLVTTPSGSFIQIGIFSIEGNAQRAVATLQAAGVAASLQAGAAQGKTYWSVGARGDSAVLAKIKAAGFTDAYVTKG